ncbi:hypothetical protein BH780_gp016 [Bacillus phage Eldridge]|uniref:Uncharacterized protein n=1 Tax=Bacillus phage Eldridge TaxID=1776293 RepID=A0A0Y0AET2_9CAUD|nr:hypothetical protein BH780_gp016 [Bacillus phage Eldridge]AMB18599.1 hypothetical protein Eldridge_016 [Bacillus phage Eldridge]
METTIHRANSIPAAAYIFSKAEEENIRLTQEEKVFVAGVKPAIKPTLSYESGRLVEPNPDFLKRFYPYMNIPHRGVPVFFGTQWTMDKFLKEGTCITKCDRTNNKPVLDFDQYHLGIYLGYPTPACNWFVYNDVDEEGNLKPRKVINYHGIQFVCGEEIADMCLAWMEENRPVPAKFKTSVSCHTLGDRPK